MAGPDTIVFPGAATSGAPASGHGLIAVMDGDPKIIRLRSRAKALGEQGRRLRERARALPEGQMREMLEAQAVLLIEGGRELELRALVQAPAAGTA